MGIELLLRSIFTSFIIIFLGTLLIVGSFLIVRAYQLKAKNFYFIGIAWITIAVAQVLNQIFDVPVGIYAIFSKISFVFIVIFTNLTFYRQSKKFYKNLFIAYNLIIALSIITAFFGWYFDSVREVSQISYLISRIIDFIHASIALDWLAYSCYKTYKNIKNSPIASWVKARYQITYIFSPILTFTYLILIFHPYDVPFGTFTDLWSLLTYASTAIITLIYGISFMVAWMMPNKIKQYFSRTLEEIEDKLDEKEIMDLIRNELEKGGAHGDN